MPRHDTISFLSDFGHDDEFVGVVKSVIREIAPHATVIDLTHGVAPFDVRGGGLTLARSAQYLAPGVILAVVDPGVGSDRRAVAVEVAGGAAVLVGPDNGLLAGAVGMIGGAERAVVLDDPRFHLAAAGPTFDGEPVNLAVDDGSLPGLVFTGGARLRAWDATTGQRRWTSGVGTGRSPLLLDGVLYAATYDAVLALDATTGKVLWTTPVQLKSDIAVPLTDGRVLVVVERVPTPHLVAFDLADGRRLWQAALPEHVDNLEAVHGRAFGTRYTTSGLEVVALG